MENRTRIHTGPSRASSTWLKGSNSVAQNSVAEIVSLKIVSPSLTAGSFRPTLASEGWDDASPFCFDCGCGNGAGSESGPASRVRRQVADAWSRDSISIETHASGRIGPPVPPADSRTVTDRSEAGIG